MTARIANLGPWLEPAKEAGALTPMEAWQLHADALLRPGLPFPPELVATAWKLELHDWPTDDQTQH